MWIFFGFVTLVFSIVLLAVHRYDAKWSGVFANNCYYKESRNQKTRKLHWIEFGVSTDSLFDFEFRPESWVDRFFKSIGFSKEGLLGKEALDKNVYIVSDDERLFAVLKNNSSLHHELQYFFDVRLHVGYKINRMVCRAGKLRVRFKVLDHDSDYFNLMHQVQPHLRAMEQMLPRQLMSTEPNRDPYFLKSILLLATSSGLAINGLLQMLRIAWLDFPFIVDTWQLWTMSLLCAGVVVFLLVLGTIVLLARTSRAHLVLLEVLLVGGIGSVLSSVVHLRDINIEMDSGPSTTFDSQVIDKYTSRSRKGGTRYYITLADWNESSDTTRVKVSSSEYESYTVGEVVNVYQRPGYLNIRWVEKIVHKPATP